MGFLFIPSPATANVFHYLLEEKQALEKQFGVQTLECFPFIKNIGFTEDQVLLIEQCLTGTRILKEAFALDVLEYMHQQFSDQPRLMELVDFISYERWDIVAKYMEQERSLLSEILSEGNRHGAFNIPDVQRTAKWIQASLIKFIAPRYMDAFTLEELRQEAAGVTAMLTKGLK